MPLAGGLRRRLFQSSPNLLHVAALSPLAEKFILHWGEMGTRWGINRTVAQIHALLFLSARPLCAEEIGDTLKLARSNVSNSLHELQNWNLVKIVHVMGDRRDHFESMHDVWEMFRVIAAERKRREVDPTVRLLRETMAEAKNGAADPCEIERLSELAAFFELIVAFYDRTQKLSTSALKQLTRVSDKLLRSVLSEK
jgi:DNA-binding transcriptional regulator GbsR (MarR family)